MTVALHDVVSQLVDLNRVARAAPGTRLIVHVRANVVKRAVSFLVGRATREAGARLAQSADRNRCFSDGQVRGARRDAAGRSRARFVVRLSGGGHRRRAARTVRRQQFQAARL